MQSQLNFEQLTSMMVQFYHLHKVWAKQAKVNPILFYTVLRPLFDARIKGEYVFHDCVFTPEDGVEYIEFVKPTNKTKKKELSFAEKANVVNEIINGEEK